MGLRVQIYRSAEYDSELNAFYGKRAVTVVNLEGPFEPSEDEPSAILASGPGGDPIIVPEGLPSGMVGPMFGGTFAASSDSRFRTGTGQRSALPIHDRFETVEQYERMST